MRLTHLEDAKAAMNQYKKKVLGVQQIDHILRVLDAAEARLEEAEKRHATLQTEIAEASSSLTAKVAEESARISAAMDEKQRALESLEAEYTGKRESLDKALKQLRQDEDARRKSAESDLAAMQASAVQAKQDTQTWREKAEAAKLAHQQTMRAQDEEASALRRMVADLRGQMESLVTKFGR
jgi:chromosome segregation ATPase